MGRPKGSKNKPKVLPPEPKKKDTSNRVSSSISVKKARKIKGQKQEVTVKVDKPQKQKAEKHPLAAFVEYAVTKLHPNELAAQRRYANRHNRSLKEEMVHSLLSFFNIVDPDLKNYIDQLK